MVAVNQELSSGVGDKELGEGSREMAGEVSKSFSAQQECEVQLQYRETRFKQTVVRNRVISVRNGQTTGELKVACVSTLVCGTRHMLHQIMSFSLKIS